MFMWAYITFIGLSISLRIFFEFEFWNPIVLSITLSSMFFAIEDLFSLFYQTQKNICDSTEYFITNAREKKEEDLLFFKSIDKKIEKYKDTEHKLMKFQEVSQHHTEITEKILEIIDGIEKENFKDRKKEEKYKNLSYFFAYIGFLFLFVSLIATKLILVPQLIQDFITVISFAIILITQQINSLFIVKIEKENKENKELLQKIVAESNRWIELNENLEKIIMKIEENTAETEEIVNAD